MFVFIVVVSFTVWSFRLQSYSLFLISPNFLGKRIGNIRKKRL